MAGGAVLGMNARLYYNTNFGGGLFDINVLGALNIWRVINNVRDLKQGGSTATADATTRGNNGYRAMIPTLKELNLEFEMIHDTGDVAWQTIQNTWQISGKMDFLVMDSGGTVPLAGSGAFGVRFVGAVTKFEDSQPLTDAIKDSVTIEPAYNSAFAPFFVTL